mmetsp:Transcript_66332/g.175677  ORF Transcript_66332/g.175677 Transcript_66332/m.175677 type:complete len:206 (+) Transcript_66332:406-1023(+)
MRSGIINLFLAVEHGSKLSFEPSVLRSGDILAAQVGVHLRIGKVGNTIQHGLCTERRWRLELHILLLGNSCPALHGSQTILHHFLEFHFEVQPGSPIVWQSLPRRGRQASSLSRLFLRHHRVQHLLQVHFQRGTGLLRRLANITTNIGVTSWLLQWVLFNLLRELLNSISFQILLGLLHEKAKLLESFFHLGFLSPAFRRQLRRQ